MSVRTILHLRGELDCKQNGTNNLLDILKSCLHSKSLRPDKRYFPLPKIKTNFNQNYSGGSYDAIHTKLQK